jgi:hypothetical protein
VVHYVGNVLRLQALMLMAILSALKNDSFISIMGLRPAMPPSPYGRGQNGGPAPPQMAVPQGLAPPTAASNAPFVAWLVLVAIFALLRGIFELAEGE